MNLQKIHYTLNSGKNSKLKYYVQCYLRETMPKILWQKQLPRLLEAVERRADKDYILQRTDYYNQLTENTAIDLSLWAAQSISLKEQPMTGQSVYYHDSMEIARYFHGELKWILLPGDTKHVPALPSVTKSRPLGDAPTAVLLNLDKVGRCGVNSTPLYNV